MHAGGSSWLDWYVVVAVLIGLPCAIGAITGLSGAAKARGVGCLVMLGGLALGFLFDQDLRLQLQDARQGWWLVPIVVAADDIAPGSTITFDMISQRPVPEQFAPDSIVRPDRANEIVGKKVQGRLHAGDPVTWLAVGQGLTPEACSLNAR